MSHVYRWHPKLTAGIDGPMVGKLALHLQQSDLDGACGQHSALMALMLFGELTRDDLEGRPKKALATFWKSARPHYFVGTKPNKLALSSWRRFSSRTVMLFVAGSFSRICLMRFGKPFARMAWQ